MFSTWRADDVLTFVLAGRDRQTLFPLTRSRPKAAVPICGRHRLIDFALSNCMNSGLGRIYVLGEPSAAVLDRHIENGWDITEPAFDECVTSVAPASKRDKYLGTADAIFQNIRFILERRPRCVMILPGDRVYAADLSALISAHVEANAAVTIGMVEDSHRKSVYKQGIEVDDRGRVMRYGEGKHTPEYLISGSGAPWVDCGIYVFNADQLIRVLCWDAFESSSHDISENIVPYFVGQGCAFAYPICATNRSRDCCWEDINSLDDYYRVSMAFRTRFGRGATPLPPEISPHFKYERTNKRVTNKSSNLSSTGMRHRTAADSIICDGSTIYSRDIVRSIISPDVRVSASAQIQDSILFEGVEVGSRARIRGAIIDEGVKIPAGLAVGFDTERDRRTYAVTASGIVVISATTVLGSTDLFAARSRSRRTRGLTRIA